MLLAGGTQVILGLGTANSQLVKCKGERGRPGLADAHNDGGKTLRAPSAMVLRSSLQSTLTCHGVFNMWYRVGTMHSMALMCCA